MRLPSSQSTPSALSCPYLFCLWSLGAPPGPGPLALSSPRPLQPACGVITALLPHPLRGHRGLQARRILGLTAHTLTPKWLLTWAVEGGGGAFSRAGSVGLEGALGAAGFGELAPGWHLPGGCCALVWLQRAPALPWVHREACLAGTCPHLVISLQNHRCSIVLPEGPGWLLPGCGLDPSPRRPQATGGAGPERSAASHGIPWPPLCEVPPGPAPACLLAPFPPLSLHLLTCWSPALTSCW